MRMSNGGVCGNGFAAVLVVDRLRLLYLLIKAFCFGYVHTNSYLSQSFCADTNVLPKWYSAASFSLEVRMRLKARHIDHI